MNVTDFASAERYLSAGKSKTDRPLQNNTRLIRRGEDEIAVRLHETDVVTYHRNGNVTLNSGGWRTVTTKQRINEYAPCTVYSDKGVWWVAIPTHSLITGHWEDQTEFYDRVVVNEVGMLLSGARFSDHKAESAMVKRITKYVNGYMDRLKDGMPAPSNGDCWYCLFVTKDGKPLGDISNNSHLSDHMRERYYVPSLLINALVEKGYKYPALIAGMRDDKTMGGRGLEHSCRIALRQYLKRRLMPTANGSKPV